MAINRHLPKDNFDKKLAIDKLVEELELTRLELNLTTLNNNNDLLNEEVMHISEKLDVLIVEYLNITHGKKVGER